VIEEFEIAQKREIIVAKLDEPPAKKVQSPKQMSQRLERLRVLKQKVNLSRECFANTFEVLPVCNYKYKSNVLEFHQWHLQQVADEPTASVPG